MLTAAPAFCLRPLREPRLRAPVPPPSAPQPVGRGARRWHDLKISRPPKQRAMSGRRRVSDPEVIDLVTSSDDDDVVEVEEGWTAVAGGGGGGGGHAARQDEDDAAMALRLQEEEYRGGPVAPPARAAAAAAAQAEPVTELDWSRKYRQDQDAEYEASLAVRWARLARPRVLTSALCTLCRPIVLARRKRVLPRPQLPPRLLLWRC